LPKKKPEAAALPVATSLTTLDLVRKGYGIDEPSIVQQAIAQALDGLPLGSLWDRDEVRQVFGGARPPEVKPLMTLIVKASRALGTKLVAASQLRGIMTCDTSVVRPGDEVRLSILGPDLDKAKVGLSNMLSLALGCYSNLLDGEPKVLSFRIQRPGTETSIEVTTAALARAGGGLIARWAAGAMFTEAPRMVGEDEGAKNLDESLTALQNRMLPGTGIVLEGSPYAPWGPFHSLDREHFGKPSPEVLVIRAPGRLIWPERYTEAYCERIRKIDPRAYQADVLGQYVDPESSLLATPDIEACTDWGVTERKPREGFEYVAALDPATRANAWTLIVLCTLREGPQGEEYEVALARQWQGTPQNPLRPWNVLEEIRDLCAPFGVTDAFSDQASFDALSDIGDRVGFGLTGLFGSEGNLEADCEALRPVISGRRIRLVDDSQLRNDLQRIAKRVTTSGYAYQLPTSGDNRHCDYVPALGKAIRYAPAPPGTGKPSEEWEREAAPSTAAQRQVSRLRGHTG
jgi:hypothetical protein